MFVTLTLYWVMHIKWPEFLSRKFLYNMNRIFFPPAETRFNLQEMKNYKDQGTKQHHLQKQNCVYYQLLYTQLGDSSESLRDF